MIANDIPLYKIIFNYIAQLVILFLIVFLILIKYIEYHPDFVYTNINKDSIQKDISIALENNASTEIIKNIYNDKKKYHNDDILELFNELLNRNKDNYLRKHTTLDLVLKDIRKDIYITPKKFNFIENIEDFKLKINKVINKNEEENPFDKLESGQREYLINLKEKLKNADIYIKTKSDIEKIVNEFDEKNKLVEKYLADSTMSFWISIIAVILSLIMGIYQIILAKREKNPLE